EDIARAVRGVDEAEAIAVSLEARDDAGRSRRRGPGSRRSGGGGVLVCFAVFPRGLDTGAGVPRRVRGLGRLDGQTPLLVQEDGPFAYQDTKELPVAPARPPLRSGGGHQLGHRRGAGLAEDLQDFVAV